MIFHLEFRPKIYRWYVFRANAVVIIVLNFSDFNFLACALKKSVKFNILEFKLLKEM